MQKLLVSSVALFAICLVSFASAEEKKKESKCLCPVSGKAASKEVCSEFNGGKVYFCCGNCQAAFDKDSDKFAAKANHQLAATRQAKLVKCPLSGGKLNPATAIEVSGVKVCFCCNNCKGKAEKSEDAVALIFNNDAFKKGFKVGKKE